MLEDDEDEEDEDEYEDEDDEDFFSSLTSPSEDGDEEDEPSPGPIVQEPEEYSVLKDVKPIEEVQLRDLSDYQQEIKEKTRRRIVELGRSTQQRFASPRHFSAVAPAQTD